MCKNDKNPRGALSKVPGCTEVIAVTAVYIVRHVCKPRIGAGHDANNFLLRILFFRVFAFDVSFKRLRVCRSHSSGSQPFTRSK